MQRSSSTACASCKHQRKKCAENCILAPYFPAERSREFQAVHRVFGVSNVMKLVRNVREEDRKLLADSLIWEACCRQNDPILGALGEYRKIQEELKLYKTQKQSQINPISNYVHAYNNNGFNNSTNNKVIGGGNYGHDNGITVDPTSFVYPINPINSYVHQGLDKVKKVQDKDVGSRLVVPLHSQPQQLSVNGGFNQQQYCLSGQFGSINGKTMDNSLWEAAGP